MSIKGLVLFQSKMNPLVAVNFLWETVNQVEKFTFPIIFVRVKLLTVSYETFTATDEFIFVLFYPKMSVEKIR